MVWMRQNIYFNNKVECLSLQKIYKASEFLEVDMIAKDIQVAVDFFKKHNCQVLKVNKKNSSGPDINIIKNDCAYRVEVKKLHYMKKSNCFYTDAVTEKRKNDDYVLVVTDTSVISFDTMESHLKLSSQSGIRVFSSEMQILEESREVID